MPPLLPLVVLQSTLSSKFTNGFVVADVEHVAALAVGDESPVHQLPRVRMFGARLPAIE